MIWKCGILGKRGTPWEHGTYKLNVIFPPEYPNQPPLCIFDKPLFHPNVGPRGMICVEMLDPDGWHPKYTIKNILIRIQNLLTNPCFEKGFNCDVMKVYNSSASEYWYQVRRKAREFYDTI